MPRRLWEIDALRGLMLVLMTLTHLPTRLTSPLGQPFGYVSAAEGFVLLSACMAGLVYGRVAWRSGVPAMQKAFWKRALKVYACHAFTLAFLFTVIAVIGVRRDQAAVTDLVHFYLEHPLPAWALGLLLLYQPALFDILPMYVLFMFLSPWVLARALRHGWAPVLGLSAGLWLMAQFGVPAWVYAQLIAALPSSVPLHDTGAFSPAAWQLLWMLGLWLGARGNDPAARPLRLPAPVVVVAAVVALVGLVWRHHEGQAPFGADVQLNLLFDKWLLGPLRLLDLLALLLLAMRFGPVLAARLPRQRWLELLGRASLPVFCAQLMLVLLVLALFGASLDRPWQVDGPILAGCFAVLYAVAAISDQRDRRTAKKRAGQ